MNLTCQSNLGVKSPILVRLLTSFTPWPSAKHGERLDVCILGGQEVEAITVFKPNCGSAHGGSHASSAGLPNPLCQGHKEILVAGWEIFSGSGLELFIWTKAMSLSSPAREITSCFLICLNWSHNYFFFIGWKYPIFHVPGKKCNSLALPQARICLQNSWSLYCSFLYSTANCV